MSYHVIHADCREAMAAMPEASVDAIVTDPPYGLAFMGKGWDHGVPGVEFWTAALRVLKPGGHLLAFGGTRTYHRLACAIEDAGFEVRDCLAWVYAQGFPKSHNLDRLGLFCDCQQKAKHDVRFVPRADLSPAIQPAPTGGQVLLAGLPQPGSSQDGETRAESKATGIAQPGVARRCDAETPQGELLGRAVHQGASVGGANGASRRLHHGASASDGAGVRETVDPNGSGEPRRPSAEQQRPGEPDTVADESGPQAVGVWPVCSRCRKPMVAKGLGTALKPSYEPIILARKPLAEGTVAANVLAHGTGAVNVDGCRVEATGRPARTNESSASGLTGTGGAVTFGAYAVRGSRSIGTTDQGRWPANLVLSHTPDCREVGTRRVKGAQAAAGAPGFGAGRQDGYELGEGRRYQPDAEVPAFDCAPDCPVRLLDEQSGERRSAGEYQKGAVGFHSETGKRGAAAFGVDGLTSATYADTGGASRFFYCAKASRADRTEGNDHPTVKPVNLMRWLVRLVTPPGGVVLDPFTGSGSTGVAALREGFTFIGIEQDAHYREIALRRMGAEAPLLTRTEGAACGR